MKYRNIPIIVTDKINGRQSPHFWKKQPLEKRISAVEFLREQYYVIRGYKTIPRITHKLKLVERER